MMNLILIIKILIFSLNKNNNYLISKTLKIIIIIKLSLIIINHPSNLLIKKKSLSKKEKIVIIKISISKKIIKLIKIGFVLNVNLKISKKDKHVLNAIQENECLSIK
jgi:hypothetical protein